MSTLITDVIRSFNTIKEMLSDRNIDVSKLNGYSDEELTRLVQISDTLAFDVNDDFKIMYILRSKVKLADIKKALVNNDVGNQKNLLVVLKESPTQNNIKSFNDINSDIQIFHINNLLINITKHKLQPKFKVIKDEDTIKSLETKYMVKNRFHFPVIVKDDPVSKYYNLKHGQMLEITRPSRTAGKYLFYRVCV